MEAYCMSEIEDSPKTNISQRRKARSLLVQALYQWQMAGAFPTEIESQFKSDNTGKIDWAFFHEVLGEVYSRHEQLDALFSPYLDRPVAEVNPVELALLRMGVYEMAHRLDIPYRVVINECVELAKKFGATDSHKYINGVLDKTARRLRVVEMEGRARKQGD